MRGIIYKATCLKTNKYYIGQTYRNKSVSSKWLLNQRIIKHLGRLKKHNNNKFYNAIEKYSEAQFKWEVLLCCFDIDTLNKFESYYISFYNSMNEGYNSTTGGENYYRDPSQHSKRSQEAKERMKRYLLTKEGLKNKQDHYRKHLAPARQANINSIRETYSKPFSVLLDNKIVNTFNTKRECARHFKTSDMTVKNHLDGNPKSLYAKKYTLKYI